MKVFVSHLNKTCGLQPSALLVVATSAGVIYLTVQLCLVFIRNMYDRSCNREIECLTVNYDGVFVTLNKSSTSLVSDCK